MNARILKPTHLRALRARGHQHIRKHRATERENRLRIAHTDRRWPSRAVVATRNKTDGSVCIEQRLQLTALLGHHEKCIVSKDRAPLGTWVRERRRWNARIGHRAGGIERNQRVERRTRIPAIAPCRIEQPTIRTRVPVTG